MLKLFGFALCAVICVFIVKAAVRNLTVISTQTDEKAELQSQMSEAEKEKARIASEKEFTGTTAFYEKIAREQLGLVMPDEIIFITK